MSYPNFPKSIPTDKIDSCVNKVMASGKSKESAIAICYASMVKGKEINYRKLETVTAKASDNPSDYLVVEDKDKPTTWHLQVKKNGTPDHTLMGAAWAALHQGYRGNKYEGSNKQDAIAKLKRLYEAEKMPVPTEKAITDAPALRGEDARNCYNCKYFQALPDTAMSENMNDLQAMMGAPSDMVEMPSGRGVCTQFEFETDHEWVCDAWEEILLEDMTQKGWVTINGSPVFIPDEGTTVHGKFKKKGDAHKFGMKLRREGKVVFSARGQDGEYLVYSQKEINNVLTTKQTDGSYRWILFSSSSYQDRDGEIVSQKALETDSARMNTTQEFGTLDWWHTPLILGDCDFSEMHGRISIESGTFRDNWIGAKFATMKNLGASRMFFNPINEPDTQGVFHNIRTFSRAILPAHRASNRLTLVDISAKEKKQMLKDKVNELIQRLGGDATAKAKVEELLQAAEETDKAAQAAGLTSKETAPENITAKQGMSKDDMKKKVMSMMDSMDETQMQAMMDKAEKVMSKETAKESWFVGDMTPDEFDTRLGQAVEKFLTPAVKEIGAQVAKLNDAQVATSKEQGDKLATSIKSIQDMQTDLAARLAALEGLKPRAYRATEDPGTVVDEKTVKEKAPKGDKTAEHTVESWIAAHLPTGAPSR